MPESVDDRHSYSKPVGNSNTSTETSALLATLSEADSVWVEAVAARCIEYQAARGGMPLDYYPEALTYVREECGLEMPGDHKFPTLRHLKMAVAHKIGCSLGRIHRVSLKVRWAFRKWRLRRKWRRAVFLR